ncbi:MAG: TldD/PmbA family protein [Deltaproteobacteria bacterium]|nr:TldD/PmbA family protein [Candidatus Zymogenaceae bacterium]
MDHEQNFDRVAQSVAKALEKRRVDLYELFYSASRRLSIEAEGGAVEDYRFAEPYGVALRVINAGGMGFSFSTRPDEAAVQLMVSSACDGARYSTPDEHYAFAEPTDRLPETGPLFDEAIESVPIEEKIKRALAVEKGALGADPRVARVRSARYAESVYEVFIKNSLGLSARYKKSVVSAQLMATAEEAGDQEMGYDADYSITYAGLDPTLVGRRAGIAAVERLGARKAPTGAFRALLTNEVAAELLGVLSSSFLAENVLKGKSMLAGKEDTRIFSPQVTVIDDGVMAGGIASAPVDDEGVARRRVELVGNGVLTGFLYDLLSARRAGKRPTGCAARDGVASSPAPGTANIFIAPGKKSPEDLLGDAGSGVVITELMGVHTANPVTGEFSVGAVGFVCEGGKKKYAFKEGAVAGDLLSLFDRVVGVGSDLRFFGGVGAPSLLVEGLDISGK